jgi:hypothetical protein
MKIATRYHTECTVDTGHDQGQLAGYNLGTAQHEKTGSLLGHLQRAGAEVGVVTRQGVAL